MKNGNLPNNYESWEQLYDSVQHLRDRVIHIPNVKMSLMTFYAPTTEPTEILKFDFEYVENMYKDEVFSNHLKNKDIALNKRDYIDIRVVLQGCQHEFLVSHKLIEKLDTYINIL